MRRVEDPLSRRCMAFVFSAVLLWITYSSQLSKNQNLHYKPINKFTFMQMIFLIYWLNSINSIACNFSTSLAVGGVEVIFISFELFFKILRLYSFLTGP